MVRAVIFATVFTLGCGRLGVDALAAEAGPGSDAPADTAPVPAAICKVDRFAFASPPAPAALAIAGISEGYAAVWLDPSGQRPTQGLLLGPNHQQLAAPVLSGIRDSQVGGLVDVGQKLALATGSGTAQSTWPLGRDLAQATPPVVSDAAVLAHDPYPSDDRQQDRLFLSAAGTSVMAAYIASDGAINAASTVSHGTTGPVTALACTDGPNHVHCVWTEAVPTDGAPLSRCTATDVYMRPTPDVRGGAALSSDCHDARTSSGPSAADSMLVAWATSDRQLWVQYLSSAGQPQVQLAPAGSVPKVQFDGTRFWIAWLDGGGALRLSSYDLAGTIVPYALAGWVPLGPAAFELVRRGNETALALVSAAGLELLTICT